VDRLTLTFTVGARVQIACREFLEDFKKTCDQNPFIPEQISYAGTTAEVRALLYHRPGDELYWLKDVPGVWPVQCLSIASSDETDSPYGHDRNIAHQRSNRASEVIFYLSGNATYRDLGPFQPASTHVWFAGHSVLTR
jgi:hypothetical protein